MLKKRISLWLILLMTFVSLAFPKSLEKDLSISINARRIRDLTVSGLSLVFFVNISNSSSSSYYLSKYDYRFMVNQQEYHANGNRLPFAAPHGVYRCRGDDRWCSIAIFKDSEWKRFCEVIEKPALAEYDTFVVKRRKKP